MLQRSLLIIAHILSIIIYVWSKDFDPLSDEFIDFINANQSYWTARRNFHKDTPMEYLNALMGSIEVDSDDTDIVYYTPGADIEIPRNFDARNKWTNCTTLNDVRDQGSCASCWAVAAAACMTDRICINSDQNFYFSATDILTCCNNCGFGCQGGALRRAWEYYINVGVVSGGPYRSKQGCKPYVKAPCDHKTREEERIKCSERGTTPFCQKFCEKSYSISYTNDRHRGTIIYNFEDVISAQANLLLYGPITSSFRVYEDFLNYKGGIYRHLYGDYMKNHSVKVIGWGEENNVKYWLVANTWNVDWGDKGFFKILRGDNHCGFENTLIAGR